MTGDSVRGAEEWVSRADAAKLARRSEDAIKRDVARHQLSTRIGPSGRVMVRVEDLVRIGRISADDLTAGASAAETAELHRLREQVAALHAELGRVAGRLQERDALVTLLSQQISEKDRQIRQLTSTVDGLVVAVRTKDQR